MFARTPRGHLTNIRLRIVMEGSRLETPCQFRTEAKPSLRRRLLDGIVNYWHGVCWLIAFVAFWAAVFEDPNGEFTGSYAALIVLCVTSAGLVEIARGADRARKWTVVLGGVVTLAAAYLFVASEGESHPANIEFVLVLGILWLVAAVVVMFVAVCIAVGQWKG